MLELQVPNVRTLFVPDPGFVLFDVDLKGADARVIAWEADDADLKGAFRAGLPVHAHNAETIWRMGAPLAEYERDPSDPLYNRTLARLRQRAKTAVHAVDYGCKAKTLADHIQCSIGEAQAFIDQWFFIHPPIDRWQKRVNGSLHTRRAVSNIWGYRRQYFDRVEGLLPEALAWIGQSTTAIAINKLLVALEERFDNEIQTLLQTHDSVTFQMREAFVRREGAAIVDACRVTVPYDDPLEMPCDIKVSRRSWGELEKFRVEEFA